MKIAIIAHSVYPIKEPYRGGLEKFIHVLATELSNKGIDVTLYGHEQTQEGPYTIKPFTKFEYKFDDNFEELNRDYKDLLSELKVNNYDLIHNNSLNNDILSLSKYATPVLTTIHVPPIDGFREAVYQNFCNPNAFTNIISYACLKDWTCLNSCKVIHNGINVSKWKANYPDTEREGAIWFGRICPEKGVERAIEAADRAKLPLIVAGPINNYEYFDYLQTTYKGKFNHIGLCNHDQLNRLISGSKVFIKAPIWKEPFGLVYLEALACGTPVATYSSDIAEELLTSTVSFKTKESPIHLAIGAQNAAKYIDNNTCRKYVADNFSTDKMVTSYINYYKEILCTK